MFTRHRMFALTLVVALVAPATAGANDLSFTYVEGGFNAGFVNDVEESPAFTDNGRLDIESDSGGGGFISGAWQFRDNMHLFGEYSLVNQELEIGDGSNFNEDEYDLVRWRIGAGYNYSFSNTKSFYGRLTFDNAEFNNVPVTGFELNADDGIGGEAGMIWAATPSLHLQGLVRYTPVGELVDEGSDTFGSNTLIGLNGRWYFRPNVALMTGYEFGKITVWSLAARVAF